MSTTAEAAPNVAPGEAPAGVGKLVVLMITAFVDMVGLLMVIPLMPFYAKSFGANGFIVGKTMLPPRMFVAVPRSSGCSSPRNSANSSDHASKWGSHTGVGSTCE